MTDRIDHRAAAERLLADADEWAAQAGELSPKASERACLARAQVHALLAIHDTLAAADRYAANEARQREAGADPYGWAGKCLHEWAEDTRVGDTTRHFICTECGTTRTEDRQ